MNTEPNRTDPTSRRGRRTVLSVAIAVIATIPIAAGSSGASDETTSADTTESTVPTTGSLEATTDSLEPSVGSYVDGDVRLTYTLPDGWPHGDPGAGTIMMPVANIFSDPCQSVEFDPPPGPTVDDLVAAFADVPALNATAATDVTVDGFHGQQIEFTVPDYTDDECLLGRFALFQYAEDAGLGPSFWAFGPLQHYRLWILDVDGTRYMIGGWYFPDTSQQDRDGLDTLLNSIHIDDLVETEPSSDDDPVETSAASSTSSA